MRFSDYFSLRKSPRRKSRLEKRVSPRRALLETLERREVLTAYVVDTLDDTNAADGAISLREAIEAANTNLPFVDAPAGDAGPGTTDRITFAPWLDGKVISLDGTALTISDNLDIRHNTANPVTVDAGGASQVFVIADSANTVAISDITISGGNSAGNGGGIYVDAGETLNLKRVTIQANTAANGGGIFNDGGTVDIRANTLIRNNVANGAPGSGGGIFNNTGGTLFVQNSDLLNNQANRAGGGIEDDSGAGLGVTLKNVNMTGNNAGLAPATAAPGNGGALHVTGPGDVRIIGGSVDNNVAAAEGGGLWNGSGTMTIRGTFISNNTASGDASDQGGGGIFNAGGTLDVRNVLILGNVADGMSGSGGGILNDAGGTIEVSNSNLRDNVANRAGGGIEDNSGAGLGVVLNNVRLDFNNTGVAPAIAAPGNGGGLHVTGPGDVQITGGSVDGNVAAAEGGGLWNGTGTMTINRTSIKLNTANGNGADQGGGGIFNAGGIVMIDSASVFDNVADGTAGSGGGILNDVGGTLLISDSRIRGNRANRAGGGIEDNSGEGLGIVLDRVNLDRNNVGLAPATAAPGNGGGLHITGPGDATVIGGTVIGNVAAAEGGGLWNGTGLMTVEDVRIRNNTASGNDPDQGGGGIFNAGGTVNVNLSHLYGNTADGTAGSGGGILNDAGGTLTVTDSVIERGSAVRAGGGIEVTPGTMTTIVNSNINFNSTGNSPGNGGGLHATGAATVNVTGGAFIGNDAAAEGGGLWNGSGTMTIDGTNIINNRASGDSADQGGGGIFNAGGTLNVMNATILSNRADGALGSGGGILNDAGGTLDVSNSRLAFNSSNRAGGGIEDNSGAAGGVFLTNVNLETNSTGINGGGLHITGAGNSTITGGLAVNNTADQEGGGLWNGGGTMTIDGTTIHDNTASGLAPDQGGGGLFNAGGTLIVSNATVIDNTADGDAGSGGGILNDGGTLTITASTINRNTAVRAGGGIEVTGGSTTTIDGSRLSNNDVGASPGNGGGLHISGDGNVEITGSAVRGNHAANEGGGLWNSAVGILRVTETDINNNRTATGGGVFTDSVVTELEEVIGGMTNIVRSTIADNRATGDGGGVFTEAGMTTINTSTISGNRTGNNGGGVRAAGGNTILRSSTVAFNHADGNGGGANISGLSLEARNTIFANNTATGLGPDLHGTFTSNNFNLIGDDSDATILGNTTDNIVNIDPNLGALANNGGPTRTHALLAGSVAIDNGVASGSATDQRGVARPQGLDFDIGAFEVEDVLVEDVAGRRRG